MIIIRNTYYRAIYMRYLTNHFFFIKIIIIKINILHSVLNFKIKFKNYDLNFKKFNFNII